MTDLSAIRAEILRQTAVQGAERSICPSDVARALDEDWRRLLGPVRLEAARLASEGLIDILRKGKRVEPSELRGVIRLRRAASPVEPDTTP